MANVASPPRRMPTKPGRTGTSPVLRRLPRTFKARLGTIVGSLLSAVAGWSVLYFSEPFVAEEDRAEALEIFAGDFDDETQESV